MAAEPYTDAENSDRQALEHGSLDGVPNDADGSVTT